MPPFPSRHFPGTKKHWLTHTALLSLSPIHLACDCIAPVAQIARFNHAAMQQLFLALADDSSTSINSVTGLSVTPAPTMSRTTPPALQSAPPVHITIGTSVLPKISLILRHTMSPLSPACDASVRFWPFRPLEALLNLSYFGPFLCLCSGTWSI